MPQTPPSQEHRRLTAARHLYSLARRPDPHHSARPDGLRYLVHHEVTDHWQAVANLRKVRASQGLRLPSGKAMGSRAYMTALAEVLDGYDVAILDTKRGPQDRRVRLVQVVAVAQDLEEVWLDVFRDLDGAEDFDAIDALAVEAGLDISSPLPPEYVSTVVPTEATSLVCRSPQGCGRTLPLSSFRVKHETDRKPRPAVDCLDCERARLARRRVTHPQDAAAYSSDQRDRYKDATLTREARGRSSEAYPDTKRCDACRVTSHNPGQDFPTERARPDGLGRECRRCLAKDADRRRHPTSTP